MSNSKPSFWGLIFLVALGYAAGTYFFHNALPVPTDAETFYSPAAESLLKGQGYTVNGQFLTGYPPVYPAILAGVYFLTKIAGTANPYYPYLVVLFQSGTLLFL